MLQIVPAVRSQGEFVDRREVPEPGGCREEQPGRHRVRHHLEGSTKQVPAKERGDPVRADRSRQPHEQGEQGSTQPEQRRRDHHQQQVLQHVDLQQQGRERLDRRGEGQEERRRASPERDWLAARPASLIPAMQREPAAQVDAGRQQERGKNPRLEWPGAQEGVECGVHRGLAVVTVGRSRPDGPAPDPAGAD